MGSTLRVRYSPGISIPVGRPRRSRILLLGPRSPPCFRPLARIRGPIWWTGTPPATIRPLPFLVGHALPSPFPDSPSRLARYLRPPPSSRRLWPIRSLLRLLAPLPWTGTPFTIFRAPTLRYASLSVVLGGGRGGRTRIEHEWRALPPLLCLPCSLVFSAIWARPSSLFLLGLGRHSVLGTNSLRERLDEGVDEWREAGCEKIIIRMK